MCSETQRHQLLSGVFKIPENDFIQPKTTSLLRCRPVRPSVELHLTDLLTWKSGDMYPKTNNKARNKTWAQINETLPCQLMLNTQPNSCNANSCDSPPCSSAYTLLLSVFPSQWCFVVPHHATLANFCVA